MRYLRFLKNLPQNTDDIYVLSRKDEYLGIPITKIITSDPSLTVREVMDTKFQPIKSDTNQIDVLMNFRQEISFLLLLWMMKISWLEELL